MFGLSLLYVAQHDPGFQTSRPPAPQPLNRAVSWGKWHAAEVGWGEGVRNSRLEVELRNKEIMVMWVKQKSLLDIYGISMEYN